MATLREYFDTYLKSMSVHADWEIKDMSGATLTTVRARISQDYDGNAKYWSFFISEAPDVEGYINSIFNQPEATQCVLSANGDGLSVEVGIAGYSEQASSTTLVFTKRIFLYVDTFLDSATRRRIKDAGTQHNFHVIVRDKAYAVARSQFEKPLAFICHDSRDKDILVRELAAEMSKLMCPIWYDEFSLNVGDSLRSSIEKGLKETQKCIIVLSPSFLLNEGWSRAEFDAIFTREILEKKNVILPVWHNVGVKEVYQYSPRLADKVGLQSSLGAKSSQGNWQILSKKMNHNSSAALRDLSFPQCNVHSHRRHRPNTAEKR